MLVLCDQLCKNCGHAYFLILHTKRLVGDGRFGLFGLILALLLGWHVGGGCVDVVGFGSRGDRVLRRKKSSDLNLFPHNAGEGKLSM